MAKPLKDETNVILNYIRKNTQGTDEWVLIGSRDIPKLFNISQLYTTKLLEPIKENPHILYEVDDRFASRFKPYKFRWVDDEQEKINHGLTSKQFFWLSEEEVQYVKDVSGIHAYDKISKILKTCNLLAGEGAKEWWVPIESKDLSDLTVSTVKETEKRINFLLDEGILVKAKYYRYYRLVLDQSLIASIKEEASQKEVKTKPKHERKKRKSSELYVVKDESPIEIGPADENNMIKVLDKTPSYGVESVTEKDYTNRQLNVENSQMVENAIVIKNSILNTTAQLQDHIDKLRELEKREEASQRSYEAFLKLSSEYEQFRAEDDQVKEELHKSELKTRQFEHEIKMLCDHNESFIMNAQARMDMLLGNVSGLLDEYILRPKYEKTDQLINSRLKIAIWDVVRDTSKAITEYKPESKYPPNLR